MDDCDEEARDAVLHLCPVQRLHDRLLRTEPLHLYHANPTDPRANSEHSGPWQRRAHADESHPAAQTEPEPERGHIWQHRRRCSVT